MAKKRRGSVKKKPATKKTVAKKAAAKKAAVKKAAVKKAPVKKAVVKKTAVKKTAVKKAAGTKPAAAPVSSGPGTFALAPAPAAVGGPVLVVVETSNDGPRDILAITVDQRHVFENVATSEARKEFDITQHFRVPSSIGWEISAGMQFLRAEVFLERPGLEPQRLGAKAPLKQGAIWLEEKDVEN